mmetsp:Transcript_5866/g.14882  ORF Transcript_5866/g.14882 Transcript_5866/m.14882 type:complete len:241 (-) Transcript_5866:1116-1838(-)
MCGSTSAMAAVSRLTPPSRSCSKSFRRLSASDWKRCLSAPSAWVEASNSCFRASSLPSRHAASACSSAVAHLVAASASTASTFSAFTAFVRASRLERRPSIRTRRSSVSRSLKRWRSAFLCESSSALSRSARRSCSSTWDKASRQFMRVSCVWLSCERRSRTAACLSSIISEYLAILRFVRAARPSSSRVLTLRRRSSAATSSTVTPSAGDSPVASSQKSSSHARPRSALPTYRFSCNGV